MFRCVLVTIAMGANKGEKMDKSQICYVAFLDIMGFANLVMDNTPEFVLKYLQNLLSVNSIFEQLTPNIKTSVISDTIAVYTPVLNDKNEDLTRYRNFLHFVGVLQYQSMTAPNFGLPLRGGITKGEFYSNNKDILFGKAWVKAYALEQKANSPRVIVDKNTNEYNCLLTMHSNGQRNNRVSLLKMDEDGELYCNYLNNILTHDGELQPKNMYDTCISSHKNRIVAGLKSPIECVRKKYLWLQKYHNYFCDGFQELKEYNVEVTP